MTFTITLPMPPSVNRLYIGSGHNKRKHPNYSAWCAEAGWRVNIAKANGGFKALPADRWYWVDIRLPLNHNGDTDNRKKAAIDLLHHMGATPDDKWLFGGTYMRCSEVQSGTCVIHARSMSGSAMEAEEQVRFLAERIAASGTDSQSQAVLVPVVGVVS